MNARTFYLLLLLAAFSFGLGGALVSGDVRWLGLCVIPGAIFSRWWRV
ncbi:hypothetical protein [Bradyrhizobium sp. Leo121]|nr:hypothetical protein [Bradyrhizobium sp. Leo121]